MREVKLPRGRWEYDPGTPLGPAGGFGAVYLGKDSSGRQVAVKRLTVDVEQAGHRELRIAEGLIGQDFAHLLPILDAGADADSGNYFVVMERAEVSLAEFIQANGPQNEGAAIAILKHIALGIQELGTLVHRDVKPGNILLQGEAWKIADFGIAKFVAEATSANTLRGFLSYPYAAPELWRREDVTKAADVYALGCVAHFVLRGVPPFRGPLESDYRRQHDGEAPPPLAASNRLRLLVTNCLRKPPEARPSIARSGTELEAIEHVLPSAVDSQLQEALAEVRAVEASQEAERQRTRSLIAARRELASAGIESLGDIVRELFNGISGALGDEVRRSGDLDSGVAMRAGHGSLIVTVPFQVLEEAAFPQSGWNVAAGAVIRVTQEGRPYKGRGANLWYAKLGTDESFRWWEQAYMTSALLRADRSEEPLGVSSMSELFEADRAGVMITTLQRVGEQRPIDDGNLSEFVDRWKKRFALAIGGKLTMPMQWPPTD